MKMFSFCCHIKGFRQSTTRLFIGKKPQETQHDWGMIEQQKDRHDVLSRLFDSASVLNTADSNGGSEQRAVVDEEFPTTDCTNFSLLLSCCFSGGNHSLCSIKSDRNCQHFALRLDLRWSARVCLCIKLHLLSPWYVTTGGTSSWTEILKLRRHIPGHFTILCKKITDTVGTSVEVLRGISESFLVAT